MPKTEQKSTTTEPSALDRVLAAAETAKTKVAEAGAAVTDLIKAAKDAGKESKAQTGDLEKARATLQKLQAISL